MVKPAQSETSQTVLAIGCCVFGLLAFAIQDAIVKELTTHYPVVEVIAIRTTVVLILLLGIALWWEGWHIVRTQRTLVLMIRGVLAFMAFSTYYLALTVIPLAEAATVYMTAPLFVSALSIPLLGERVGWHRACAVVVGFAAVVYMVNPGSSLFQIATILPLFSALSYAMIPIINRRIGLSEHALTMAIYTTLSYAILCWITSIIVYWFGTATPGASLFSQLLTYWTVPSGYHLLLCAIAATIFIFGLLGLTQAYRLLPVSIVAPFEYSYIVWATILGFIAFGDVPGFRTIIGAIVVVGAGLYIMYRESRTRD